MSITLLYIPARQIVGFVSLHPIDWANRELAARGGIGDQAGRTPTPAAAEFLQLLLVRRELFTQEQFWNYCYSQWGWWFRDLTLQQRDGVKAKMYRNIYPSMIDSLHAWSLLSETGRFDACILDSLDDAVGKSDLTLCWQGNRARIALIGPTQNCVQDREYKLTHRAGPSDLDTIVVKMPFERKKSPGNKRWYELEDFRNAFRARSSCHVDTTRRARLR